MQHADLPFELHLTVELPSQQFEQAFKAFCASQGCKPLFIELAQGMHARQPMLSHVIRTTSLEAAMVTANRLSHKLEENGFKVLRLKIEVPAESWPIWPEPMSSFDRYFEWHGKINFIDLLKLETLCLQHRSHLSLNALRGEPNTRFVTLREPGPYANFVERRGSLILDLIQGGWNLSKQQSEYCIYDNNQYLDHGWLPQ